MKSFFEPKNNKTIKNKIQKIKLLLNKIQTEQIEEKQSQEQQQNITKTSKTENISPKQIQQQNNTDQTQNTDKKTQTKEQILNIIRQENLTGGEVKQKAVDQAQLCSKASFYRYIQELKKEGKIESININNQEFLYSKL